MTIHILILNPPSLRTFTSTNLLWRCIPSKARTGPAPLSRDIRTLAHPSSTFTLFHSSPNDPTPCPRGTPPRITSCAVDSAHSDPPSCTRKLRLRLLAAGAVGKLLPSISHSGLGPPSTLAATSSPSRVALAEIRTEESNIWTQGAPSSSHHSPHSWRRRPSVKRKAQVLPRQCSTHYDLSNRKQLTTTRPAPCLARSSDQLSTDNSVDEVHVGRYLRAWQWEEWIVGAATTSCQTITEAPLVGEPPLDHVPHASTAIFPGYEELILG
ncbi:hypothetical protein BKA65DRAFT_533394 [Rhexocercosporidium sp. MPI-PUGE-AT-0058]|nr:hypothetical protein BKA65DRAFT_533394 [Rhexocercosporidium sp. MPI-PUGE-AT-0058]